MTTGTQDRLLGPDGTESFRMNVPGQSICAFALDAWLGRTPNCLTYPFGKVRYGCHFSGGAERAPSTPCLVDGVFYLFSSIQELTSSWQMRLGALGFTRLLNSVRS